MENISSIDIILITYQRIHFLKKTIEEIDKRTFYPHRIIVVDNGSIDGTRDYLKQMKLLGKISDVVYLDSNIGQCNALNEGFKKVGSEYFVTTQDDLLPPDLRPCWLERLLHLYKKHEPDVGAICMRIQRTRRLEWNETDDIIYNRKSMPSVFRMQRKDDMEKLGARPFGRLLHWESHTFAASMDQLKKKFGMATQLYSDHIGFMSDNKGYVEDFTNYFTYSKERVKQGEEKPYPIIDPKTNIPLEIIHPVDKEEHDKRLEHWGIYSGRQSTRITSIHRVQQTVLGDYVEQYGGKWADLGCGVRKCHPSVIGVDIFPYDNVDIVHDVSDLWFFKDGELDGITASHCLEHLADTKKVLTEWARVIKSGGYLIFIVPDGESRPKTIREASHKVAFTIPVLDNLIRKWLGWRRLKLELVPNIPKASIIGVFQKR